MNEAISPEVLLARLRALIDSNPGIDGRGEYARTQYEWLGRAHFLMSVYNSAEATTFKTSCDWAAGGLNRSMNVAAIHGALHRAVASLEGRIPASNQVFGPGATYDFFRALTGVIGGARASLFVIDPYLDSEVFDTYLSAVVKSVLVRLLVNTYATNVKSAAERFSGQHGIAVDVRRTAAIHDRLLIVDEREIWVIGASIKDAATKKPTYLAPLAADVVQPKLAYYEDIWAVATPI